MDVGGTTPALRRLPWRQQHTRAAPGSRNAEAAKRVQQLNFFQQLWQTGLVLVVLFFCAVLVQLNVLYWGVPFRTRFSVPLAFVFTPRMPENDTLGIVIAEAEAALPSLLVRRLWTRRRTLVPLESGRSRNPDRCMPSSDGQGRCEASGTLNAVLHWVLPESVRNQQAGTVTVVLTMWQEPHPRVNRRARIPALPLCEQRRSVRVLAYRSSTERAMQSLLTLPHSFLSALSVWRWTQKPVGLASRDAQLRSIELLRCATLQIVQEARSTPVFRTWNASRRAAFHFAVVMLRTVAHWIGVLSDNVIRRLFRDQLLGGLISLIPLGIGEWINDRFVRSHPPVQMLVRLELYQFAAMESASAYDRAQFPFMEMEDGSATMHFEWVLVGWRRFLRQHYFLGTLLGSWILFGIFALLYLTYKIGTGIWRASQPAQVQQWNTQ